MVLAVVVPTVVVVDVEDEEDVKMVVASEEVVAFEVVEPVGRDVPFEAFVVAVVVVAVGNLELDVIADINVDAELLLGEVLVDTLVLEDVLLDPGKLLVEVVVLVD